MMSQTKIAIIGGGAAGFFAAIHTGESNSNAEVTLLESGKHFLDKVRISGGGRCNVTHSCFEPAELVKCYPRGGKTLRGPFSRFQPRDTVDWFEFRGVKLKTEADGRMFPVTDDSITIVNCLIDSAKKAGVKLRNQSRVRKIKKVNDSFEIGINGDESIEADKILLACGGSRQGFDFASAFGHSIIPPVPSIFTFHIEDPALHELSGLSVENAKAELLCGEEKLKENGPLLITHWGMSGPVILKLSAFGARLLNKQKYKALLRIDWLPELNQDGLVQILNELKNHSLRKQIGTFSPEKISLPNRLWKYLLHRSNITSETKWAEVSKKAISKLSSELKQSEFQISGKSKFKEEFVTCGGVDLKEVNFKTMESKICPGLFFAGEILDIDGITGGFNFQNAWTTGWIAGKSLVS